MPEADPAVLVAAEWVAKAQDDLRNAAHTLKLGRACPTGTVCFHAQQCVEKYLKAYLVWQGVYFPKTHEIEALLSLIAHKVRPSLSVEEQALLTEYATGPRYPGWRDVPLSEARRAVAPARGVRNHVRSMMPKGALRRRMATHD
jgi:HEPN domain-containing protein